MTGKKTDIQVIKLDEIGEIKFIRKSGIKRLRIILKPLEGISIIVPWSTSYQEAIRFLELKKNWLERGMKKIREINSKYTVFVPGDFLETQNHMIHFVVNAGQHIALNRQNEKCYVSIPVSLNPREEHVQKEVRIIIEKILRLEAKSVLPVKVSQFAKKFGLTYKKVFIKNTRTRWGSCSAVNNINLNMHLMRLPEHLCDYVIMHELAHTIHKNHGPDFHRYLRWMTDGNHDKWSKELKGYHSTIW